MLLNPILPNKFRVSGGEVTRDPSAKPPISSEVKGVESSVNLSYCIGAVNERVANHVTEGAASKYSFIFTLNPLVGTIFLTKANILN